MRYTVQWEIVPRDALADIWLEANDRNAVAFAANEIDRLLAGNADLQGEAAHEGLRSLVVSPLMVLFEVRPDDRIVQVVRVRRVYPPSYPNGIDASTN